MSSFGVALALRSPYAGAAVAPDLLRSRIAECARAGLVRQFHISADLPGAGGPSSRMLADWTLEQGGEPVITLAAAGTPGAALADQIGEWQRVGVRRFLFVTGDHPPQRAGGENPFELDSVQMLMLLRRYAAADAGAAADLHAGAVISLGKMLESELTWQYARLRRKIEVGADFILAQAGYDPRAWDELLRFCRIGGLAPSLSASVIIPDAELARRIAAGAVPGVAIPPFLLERLAARPGRGGLRLAAAAVATLRGLGYHGVLLGGRSLAPDEIALIIGEAERLRPRWRECLGEFQPALPRFSYYREDPRTGLNTDELGPISARTRAGFSYRFSAFVDYVAFGSWKPFYEILVQICRFCDERPFWRRALRQLEYLSKAPIYRCRMCGDCTLYACGFLCAESGCPKRMVNGPCGGSRDGRCEVEGVGTCFWVNVYGRLKSQSDRPSFPAAAIPPKDRRLAGSCSWINFCLGRDHRGR